MAAFYNIFLLFYSNVGCVKYGVDDCLSGRRFADVRYAYTRRAWVDVRRSNTSDSDKYQE
jgi:hypothetical protein